MICFEEGFFESKYAYFSPKSCLFNVALFEDGACCWNVIQIRVNSMFATKKPVRNVFGEGSIPLNPVAAYLPAFQEEEKDGVASKTNKQRRIHSADTVLKKKATGCIPGGTRLIKSKAKVAI